MLISFISFLLKAVCPWIWKGLLKAGEMVGELADRILGFAEKINNSIVKFADWLVNEGKNIPGLGPIAWILGKGLKMIAPGVQKSCW